MTPCAARTPAAAWKNPHGGGGTDCRNASAGRGVPHAGAGPIRARRCQRRRRRGRGDRDVVRRKNKFSAHPPCCSVHGAQQRGKPGIAHNELFGSGRKKRQDGRFPRQGCGIPDARDELWTPQQLLRASAARQPHSARRAGKRASPTLPSKKYEAGAAQCGADPHPAFEHFQKKDMSSLPREVRGLPKLRGSRDAPRTMPGTSDATKPTPGWKQPPPQESGPG